MRGLEGVCEDQRTSGTGMIGAGATWDGFARTWPCTNCVNPYWALTTYGQCLKRRVNNVERLWNAKEFVMIRLPSCNIVITRDLNADKGTIPWIIDERNAKVVMAYNTVVYTPSSFCHSLHPPFPLASLKRRGRGRRPPLLDYLPLAAPARRSPSPCPPSHSFSHHYPLGCSTHTPRPNSSGQP